MVNRIKIILIMLFGQNLWALSCPEGASRVVLTLPTDQSTVEFCQKNFGGNLLKHGPYKKTSADGLIEEKYFARGKEGHRAPIQKAAKAKVEDPCVSFKANIQRFLNLMTNKDEGTHRRVVNNSELCPGHPRERLMFMAMGTPFTYTLNNRKKCHIKGSMKWVAKKKGHAFFKVRPPFTIDSIEYDYLVTRGGQGNERFITVKITNGSMKKEGKPGDVKFSVEQRIRANLIDLKTSRGREGLFTEEPVVVVSEAFGRSC